MMRDQLVPQIEMLYEELPLNGSNEAPTNYTMALREWLNDESLIGLGDAAVWNALLAYQILVTLIFFLG